LRDSSTYSRAGNDLAGPHCRCCCHYCPWRWSYSITLSASRRPIALGINYAPASSGRHLCALNILSLTARCLLCCSARACARALPALCYAFLVPGWYYAALVAAASLCHLERTESKTDYFWLTILRQGSRRAGGVQG